jgi:hypothetical protein
MGLGAGELRSMLHEAQIVEVALTDVMVALERISGGGGDGGGGGEEQQVEAVARALGKRVTSVARTAAELIQEDM